MYCGCGLYKKDNLGFPREGSRRNRKASFQPKIKEKMNSCEFIYFKLRENIFCYYGSLFDNSLNKSNFQCQVRISTTSKSINFRNLA